MIEKWNYGESDIFHLQEGGMSYGISAGPKGIFSLYWGGKIEGNDLITYVPGREHSSFEIHTMTERMEYDTYDGRHFTEPCLKAESDSARFLFPVYEGYQIVSSENGEKLILTMREDRLVVKLHYRFCLSGILERYVEIQALQDVKLDTLLSGALTLPERQETFLRYTTGRWAGEWQVQDLPVNQGIFTLSSRRGITGPHFNPSAMYYERGTTEENGRVWSVMLAYSGNWMIKTEKTSFGNTRILCGMSSFDYCKALKAGETAITPVVYAGYTEGGFGETSRMWHRFFRNQLLPSQNLRPVLYNSWEATTFDVTAENQKQLARIAAFIGCERFVVDDGWFGKRGSDNAGLGDWYVNPKKFPDGLEDLIDYVKDLGMDFGIWIEPEAVNPDSDLYREHPDWIYRTDEKQPITLRNQYELNFSKPEVMEYTLSWMRELLSIYDIRFLKWDMNRALTDVDACKCIPGTLWEAHVKALYKIWEIIREEFPQVEMETCAGGGGRIDAGILKYADQFWTSDNTDPFDRLTIQYGCSQFYPPAAMMCWVTDSGEGARKNASLSYRFHSAMCGGLGIGSDISKFTEEEKEECRRLITEYKQYRPIIQRGNLYRIRNPAVDNSHAVLYVTDDKREAVIIAFLHSRTFGEPVQRIRLQGLSESGRYLLSDGKDDEKELLSGSHGKILSGSTLMNLGISVELIGDYDSSLIYLKQIN